MILKYKHKDDEFSSVTEIVDLTMRDGDAVFTPVADNFYDIIITGLSADQYEAIVSDLYRSGKADVTPYANNTDYDGGDDEDEYSDEYED